jgi:hypothetical protein
MQQQAEAASRPYVTIAPFTLPGHVSLFLRISNSGKTAAQRLRLTIDRPFYRSGREEDAYNLARFAAFTEEISSFSPGSDLIFNLGPGFKIFGDTANGKTMPVTFTITATYAFVGKVVTETTTVDLRPFLGMHLSYDPVVEHLNDIRESVKRSSDALNEISITLKHRAPEV